MDDSRAFADELRRARVFDRPGPRYTSYPTALSFHDGVGAEDYAARLAAADAAADQGLGLYLHVPFCEALCTFCACHVVATRRRDVATRYVADVGRELDLLAVHLPRRRGLAQMHWGGGTPTYLEPAELRALFAHVTRGFELAPGAELAIEIDPRVTTGRHLEVLAACGFNRLSLGVQDLTAPVQEAIGRRQTFEQTARLVTEARAHGLSEGLNFDLVYGLPGQTVAGFATNLDLVLELAPRRIALYSFAYVPWSRPHQKRLDAASLPGGDAKLELLLAARERFVAAGYVAIGIDHFALPDDELATASVAGALRRNFMGYSPRAETTLLAAGVSGIAELEGAYFQNERKLAAYAAALDAGRLPVERGYLLSADDRVRRYVIHELMCRFALSREALRRRFGIELDDTFAAELRAIAALEQEGDAALVVDEGERLALTATGRLFVRNVCMVFDRYLPERGGGTRPAYSRTV